MLRSRFIVFFIVLCFLSVFFHISFADKLVICPESTGFMKCMPSLGMVTINVFAAVDSILIPVQAAFLPAKGLEQMIKTINKVKRQINPNLEIEGILLTMVDGRTNYAKEIMKLLREGYEGDIRFFRQEIPRPVRAEETSAVGVSIYEHDPRGKVAAAYQELTREILGAKALTEVA